MKTASILLCAAAFIFASASCDSHSFEETKVLHEGMHKEHHGDPHGQKDAHGAEDHGHSPEKKEEAKAHH
ncbi:MAG: hypothetical protein ACO1TE_20280 [Prosthecobacter sp.]